MNVRFIFSNALLAFLMAFMAGCGRSDSNSQSSGQTTALTPSPDAAIRVHWLGRRQLDLDVGAYYFSRIWSLPETKRLQAQTFDKLATNVWHLLLGDAIGAQIPATALRPLFEDLALEESYFELRVLTNSQISEWCFAIHMDSNRRAGTWITNMAVAAQVLTGGAATPEPAIHGWTIQGTKSTQQAMVSHLGEWIIVSAGSIKNPLFDEIAGRIFHDGAPVPRGPTNFWLDVDIDLNRAARVFPFLAQTDANLSHVQFRVTGDGSHVIADGRATLSQPLPTAAEAWHVPTNLIHEPLLSMTSIRGVQPILAEWKLWNDWQLGAPPGQFFFWSMTNSPFNTYVAAPSATADHQISTFSDFLMQQGNQWLAKNGYINFHRAPDSNGVVWGNVPTITPFIRAADENGGTWLYAGLLPQPAPKTNASISDQIVQKLNGQTNLVYYDWELTGQMLPARLALLQTGRQIARTPQMATDSDSLNWLGVLIPRLGPTETTISQTAPNELTFHRKSTVGFTAIELHLLADWLESSKFPRGLHSVP